jgi:hypothetical protein
MGKTDKYVDGIDMNQFSHIKVISNYNSNYYNGFDKDLLFGLSDDDNTTEWFLINGCNEPIVLGYSLCSEDEKLHRMEYRCT